MKRIRFTVEKMGHTKQEPIPREWDRLLFCGTGDGGTLLS
jgi:hypothetical protein